MRAVDKDKVRSVVSNVESWATIAHNGDHIDSLLKDAASLAKHLNDTAGQLDSALNDVRSLVQSVDTKKVANVVDKVESLVSSVDPATVHSVADNIATFTATLSRNQGNIDTILTGAAKFGEGSPGRPCETGSGVGQFQRSRQVFGR